MITASPTSTESALLLRELASIVGPEAVLSGGSERRVYDCDAYTVEKATPFAVVLPQTTEQVSALVKLCNRLQVPFTPRGAGTGLSGGTTAVQGGVIISTMRLNRILHVDLVGRP
jgi:glycolate oxidase